MYIIGIDTGGTYTDAVIMDYKTKKVIKTVKVFTTKENLYVCIEQCFDKFEFDEYDKVSAVCISTTLATNAIVENTSCPSGTILIGKRPDGDLPDSNYQLLDALIDIRGDVKIPLEDNEVDKAVDEFKKNGQKIEAVAISGYASTRNPEFEHQIKEKVEKKLKVPVVCAHELTTSLGFSERTVTAVLNAGLIPIITELVKAVKKVFKKYKVEATYMVVDGTGCLLYSEKVLDQPISTILSGPASSTIGAQYLTGIQNGLIVDIGGTTTDIARVKGGKIAIDEEGAQVGSWHTRVEAASIHTFGLGGDTRIYLDSHNKLILSSERVWPFSYMIWKYPYLYDEMQKYAKDDYYTDMEIFQAYRKAKPEEMCEEEKAFLHLIEDGPHCSGYLKEKGFADDFDELANTLYKKNWLIRGGFTPTDLMHVIGLYTEYDKRGAEFALQQLSIRSSKTKNEITQKIIDMISDKFIDCCMQVYGDDKNPDVICIGAPAKSWMTMMKDRLKANVIVPEYAETANAIGAAVGSISPSVDILIRPDNVKNVFHVYTQEKRESFSSLNKAKEYAKEIARQEVKKIAEESQSKQYEISENMEDIYCENSLGEQVYVETKLKVLAVGIPELYE